MRTWFQEAFKRHFGQPVEVQVPVSAHASGRVLYRLSAQDGASAIGAIDENENDNRAFMYLTTHFGDAGLAVPTIYDAQEARGYLLMEDLGEATLMDLVLSSRDKAGLPSAAVQQLYRDVVTYLPRFQVEAGCSVDFTQCYPREEFDRESILWDMHYYRREFLTRKEVNVDLQALERDFDRLADLLVAADCSFFMYRDFQARNIMVKQGKCGYIDYQGGRRGPLPYDLVSLIHQSRAALPQDFRDELVGHYLESLARYTDVNREQFLTALDGFVLVRMLQVLGTYGKLGLGEGKQYFLDSIPYALKNVAALGRRSALLDSLPALRKSFEDLG